ncbi:MULTISPECIES: 5-carboxymethyl-2-hydroxymuconate Delta-isomerase [Amycolatopsis]|uniref:5-carboxymethyl-2-hydroxymuconate Delta-isomerase n=1 Tax=Amycolatopsis albidoflavus TaxID=102226 RepID=A0ABW5HSH1_9PSEU
MPQITVQYPFALAAGFDTRRFALTLHTTAADLIDSPLAGFKTRFLVLYDTVVGDGSPGHHMVHALVEIRPGRTDKCKEQLGEMVLRLLETHLVLPGGSSVQVTTEIRELHNYRQIILPRT